MEIVPLNSAIICIFAKLAISYASSTQQSDVNTNSPIFTFSTTILYYIQFLNSFFKFLRNLQIRKSAVARRALLSRYQISLPVGFYIVSFPRRAKGTRKREIVKLIKSYEIPGSERAGKKRGPDAPRRFARLMKGLLDERTSCTRCLPGVFNASTCFPG